MKNWRTTLAGLSAGLAIVLAPYAEPGATFTWQNIVIALGIALLGYLSKDSKNPQV